MVRPKLMVVGAMLGCHPGHVPSFGEALGEHLSRRGYPVVLTSARRQRLSRLTDMTLTLLRHGRQTDVQILQVYSGLSFVIEDLASWIGVRLRQRIIMHLHGGALPAFVARHPVWSRRVLRRAYVIVAPSPYLKNVLTPLGFDVRIIPNAINLSLYPYRHRRAVAPRLLWMRTFHAAYNPQMAVRTFARLKEFEPLATMVMAGQDKGMEADVRRLSREYGVADGIRFAGFLNDEAKIREGSTADIFLNTNRIDNTPVSVIEACALGLPIVATRVGGISDLLTHNESALLVPDNDDRAMAEAILQLLRDPDLAARLSAGGRRIAEQCSWDEITCRWQDLLAEVTETVPGQALGEGVA